jgi:hypothetical protein
MVAPNFALTSAQCVLGTGWNVRKEEIGVFTYMLHTTRPAGVQGGVVYDVRDIWVHPK